MQNIVTRLKAATSKTQHLLQLDSPLSFVLLTRIWQTISGPVTIALLIAYMPKSEQGVYYGILGIVGIQAYFELGLLSVLVSHASHLFAALNNTETPNENAEARMQTLIRTSFQWFAVGAVLFALVATVVGWRTLTGSEANWTGPLICVVVISAVTVRLAPALSILEGAGFRELIYRYRLFQAVLGSLTVWLCLFSDLKLWTLVASSAVQAALAIYIRYVATKSFWHRFRDAPTETSDFSWTREVLPAQWRVALISISFHFATQFFVVIVIMFHGDAAGAPLGMTLSVTNAIQMLAAAWVQSKYPVISGYLASGQRERAGTMWRRTAVLSSGILILASAAFLAGVAALPWLFPRYTENFLSPFEVLLLCIGHLAGHIASVQGFYVLARKAKPLLAASLIGAFATGVAVWTGGYFYSTIGVVAGYGLAMSLVLVPVHTKAYLAFRKQTV